MDGCADVLMSPTRGGHALSGTSSTLYGGCVYKGFQTSDDKKYHVSVKFKHVDLENSFLCGDLLIQGLTDQYPELTTFFDVEIIGDKHSFVTGKWEASEDVDLQHWRKFEAFRGLEDKFNSKGFQYDFRNSDHIFMRWKEHFLVPDHKVSSIKGASFAGFYYICFNRRKGIIEGLYYHSASEWFQALRLELQAERCFPAYDFR